MQQSVLTRNQEKTFTNTLKVNGRKGRIDVVVKYDDRCRNNHNTFSISATIYDHPTSTLDKHCVSGGGIHEEVSKYFPKLRHLIKWDGMTSEEPLHYISNTLCYSDDRTHMGVDIGSPVRWETRLKFDSYPFTFKQQTSKFWDFLKTIDSFQTLKIVPVVYGAEGDGNSTTNFDDKYSFEGFELPKRQPWYHAPFDTLREAEEFLEALRNSDYTLIESPTKWCEAVEPQLDKARYTAIWEDATLEQLQSKEALEARLPALMEEFRKDIENFGFVF